VINRKNHVVARSGKGVLILCLVLPLKTTNTHAEEQPPCDASAAFEETHGWSKFLGPTGDGKSPETGILTEWPEDGLEVVWQKQVGEGYGIGAVSPGRYFHFDRHGDQARLTCTSASTGAAQWTFKYATSYTDRYGYDGGPRCSPIVDDDRVYLYGAEGMLHCLRVEDGSVLWKVDTCAEFGVAPNFFGVGSNPVVFKDLLLVMVGGTPPESELQSPWLSDRLAGNGTAVVAFDKRSGKVAYRTGDELASYASLKLAEINGRWWCFAFARGGLLAFDPSNGKIDFHYPWRGRMMESVNASVPVVVKDEVFLSETYGPGASLLRVRPGGYDVIWKDELRSRERRFQAHWSTPIYHNGYLYGCSGRHKQNAELRCIHWKTGKLAWSVPKLARTSLLYVDGHFVCLGEYGVLLLFRASPVGFELVAESLLRDKDGELLLDYPCWAAPILADGQLYVRGKGRVICLRLIPPR